MNLGGLSATYPGFSAQENQTATTQQNQAAAQEAAYKLLGAQVLGRALTGQQGPQPPAPGQPSVPTAPSPQANPQPMGQSAPPQASAPQPAAGPAGAPPAQGGSGLPEVSLQALTQRILATSPGVRNHPEILMAALERAAPLLDRQSKEDLAELRKNMSTQRLESAAAIAQARQESLDSWRGAQGERADRKLNQADTREQRLAAAAGIRQDQGWQRLEMQKQDLQRKIEQGGDKQALAQWRAVVDAQHKRATEIIQANSITSNLTKDDKKTLLDEQRSAYEAEIAAMRGKMGSTTPTGGTAPAGAPAEPKVQGQVSQGGPAAAPSKPIPFEVRQQYDAAAAKPGFNKDAAIKYLQDQGYKTDGL